MRYFIYLRRSQDDDNRQVLSLESQQREVRARFGDQPDIELLEEISESRSARYPGRPLFNEMLERIERGEADGIVAWQPDRVSRNAVDSGRIVNMLDQGKLKELKFVTYSFENTAVGKLMLQILLANAKYQVDHMSDNIRTGNRTKILNGWRPNLAPIGYLNDKNTKTIVPDPERFLTVKRIWELMLTGAYTVPQLRDLARDAWGLRRKQLGKTGGTALTISGIYWLFQNPFYAGILRHEGSDFPGKHQAMITIAQFASVQRLLGRDTRPRERRHEWTYTGLMTCLCGHAITAEKHINRFGSTYYYYRCARNRPGNRCLEPYVREAEIETAFREFIRSVTLPPEFHEWALNVATRDVEDIEETLKARRAALDQTYKQKETELRNLRHMRLREQISESEFVSDRQDLERERASLAEMIVAVSPAGLIEPLQAFILFNVRALKWFDEGERSVKRMIIETACQNPVLHAKNLNIDGRFPFSVYPHNDVRRHLCTALDVIGTLEDKSALHRLVATVRILASEEDRELFKAA
jgi:site-specific DNA recombinase